MRSNPTGLDWVLIWAGTITLLRAVGHALDKEDAESDGRLKKERCSWWKKLKATESKPSIFRDFIDRDKNLLLHEAKLTVGQAIHVELRDTICASDAVSGHLSGQQAAQPEQQPPPPCSAHSCPPPASPTYSYHMNSGPFAGQDPRDLVRDAIEWWENQLDDIEQKAAGLPP